MDAQIILWAGEGRGYEHNSLLGCLKQSCVAIPIKHRAAGPFDLPASLLIRSHRLF